MQAILMSIQPQGIQLITSGKRTVDVRKTRPKLKTPFKVYICCTNGKPILGRCLNDNSLKETPEIDFDNYNRDTLFRANGKVIGEFVCDEIIVAKCGNYVVLPKIKTMLDELDLLDYADEKTVYGWHISNLIIYYTPKELGEFYAKCNKFDLDKKEVYEAHCTDCGNEHGIAPCEYINKKWCVPIKRPPQSWCYVEEREDS